MSMIRSKWAAVGAAVAVTLGAGGVSLTQAAIGSGDKPVYVALDAPCRVIDTRLASPIGAGETNTLTVQITGPNGDCTGPLAVPAAAVAVATNVTAIQPNGAPSGRSFFTVYPANAALPTTSNLNFVNGQPPAPNKVDVGLSTDGKIKIYNNQGTAHAAVDIFGYYIDHHHDDRYYTESETDAKLGTKANTVDVYTKTQADASFIPQGEIVLSHGTSEVTPNVTGVPSSIQHYSSGTTVSGDGSVNVSLVGPAVLGAVDYGLKSVEYCITNVSGGAVVNVVTAWAMNAGTTLVSDTTNRTTDGCYAFDVSLSGFHAYGLWINLQGGGSLRLEGIQTTWAPASTLTP